MNISFNKAEFINQFVTKRSSSLFAKDIEDHKSELVRRIHGKSILVIGGAGTIGSSFIYSILPYSPKSIIVIDLNENALTELVRDIRSNPTLVAPEVLVTYPVDFGSEMFLNWYKNQLKFDVVANFAALKHVRSEKDAFSVRAMISNNVIKNYRLLMAMKANRPGRLFCVSTDKAANPANVMGATKKLMEILLMAFSKRMSITTARFANVAFSNGSLPDGFVHRLQKGQPLTAPKNIKRYFVSPEESGELCMLACFLGESGDIFFPKLLDKKHEQTFTEIAEKLLQELGYKVSYCQTAHQAITYRAEHHENVGKYPVFFFESNTSGEKPLEEFYTEDESVDLNRFRALGVVINVTAPSIEVVESFLELMAEKMNDESLSKSDIVKMLREIVPGFHHIETGRNLDQSM